MVSLKRCHVYLNPTVYTTNVRWPWNGWKGNRKRGGAEVGRRKNWVLYAYKYHKSLYNLTSRSHKGESLQQLLCNTNQVEEHKRLPSAPTVGQLLPSGRSREKKKKLRKVMYLGVQEDSSINPGYPLVWNLKARQVGDPEKKISFKKNCQEKKDNAKENAEGLEGQTAWLARYY